MSSRNTISKTKTPSPSLIPESATSITSTTVPRNTDLPLHTSHASSSSNAVREARNYDGHTPSSDRIYSLSDLNNIHERDSPKDMASAVFNATTISISDRSSSFTQFQGSSALLEEQTFGNHTTLDRQELKNIDSSRAYVSLAESDISDPAHMQEGFSHSQTESILDGVSNTFLGSDIPKPDSLEDSKSESSDNSREENEELQLATKQNKSIILELDINGIIRHLSGNWIELVGYVTYGLCLYVLIRLEHLWKLLSIRRHRTLL